MPDWDRVMGIIARSVLRHVVVGVLTGGTGNGVLLAMDAADAMDGADALDAVDAMDATDAMGTVDAMDGGDISDNGSPSSDSGHHNVSFTGNDAALDSGSGWNAGQVSGYWYSRVDNLYYLNQSDYNLRNTGNGLTLAQALANKGK